MSLKSTVYKKIRLLTNLNSNKQLFVSTGFYSTLLASCIAKSSNERYENYLLVTVDRQDADKNIEFAKIANPQWKTVLTVSHQNYYENITSMKKHVLSNMVFRNIFSNHLNLIDRVNELFITHNHKIYEEGIQSLYEYIITPNNNIELHTINPNFKKAGINNLKYIEKNIFLDTLKNLNLFYSTEEIQEQSIIYLLPGIACNSTTRDYHDDHLKKLKQLSKLNYNIIVAPHPRVDFNCEYKTINQLPIIDLFLEKNRKKIKGIFGTYSTLLTYSEHIYDINPFLINGDLLSPHQEKLKDIQNLLMTEKKIL